MRLRTGNRFFESKPTSLVTLKGFYSVSYYIREVHRVFVSRTIVNKCTTCTCYQRNYLVYRCKLGNKQTFIVVCEPILCFG